MTLLNHCLFRDEPVNLFTDQGDMRVVFCDKEGNEYPEVVHYEIDDIDFTVDCSIVKDVWYEGMRDDVNTAIDRYFKEHFFLTHKDLNLVIIGI